MINRVENTVPWKYVISDFNGEEIVGKFYEYKAQTAFQNSKLYWTNYKLYLILYEKKLQKTKLKEGVEKV